MGRRGAGRASTRPPGRSVLAAGAGAAAGVPVAAACAALMGVGAGGCGRDRGECGGGWVGGWAERARAGGTACRWGRAGDDGPAQAPGPEVRWPRVARGVRLNRFVRQRRLGPCAGCESASVTAESIACCGSGGVAGAYVLWEDHHDAPSHQDPHTCHGPPTPVGRSPPEFFSPSLHRPPRLSPVSTFPPQPTHLPGGPPICLPTLPSCPRAARKRKPTPRLPHRPHQENQTL